MLTSIVVTGKFTLADGSVASGGMTFQLSVQVNSVWTPTGVVDSATGQMVNPDLIQAVVYQGLLLVSPKGGGPYLPLSLYANDDPTTSPTGSAYIVTEQLTSGSLAPWPLTLTHSAPGATVDIHSQRPVP